MEHRFRAFLFALLATCSSLQAQSPAVDEGDSLVPAIVEAPGKNGAHYSSQLVAANTGDSELVLEGLFLEPELKEPFPLTIPPRSTRLFSSEELLALSGYSSAALPLRLRRAGSSRQDTPTPIPMTLHVFNRLEDAGTYGLSFPVETARTSVLTQGETAYILSGSLEHSERLNVSLFAPFAAAAARLDIMSAFGVPIRVIPLELTPRERVQINDILAGAELGSRVHITVLSGKIQVFGTMVSNSGTNDPYRAAVLKTSSVEQRWIVPAVAETAGLHGSFFSSDLYLATLPNTHDREPLVRVTFRSRDGSPPVSKIVKTLMGSTRIVFHVLSELFPEAAEKSGILELASDDISSQWKFLAFSVTRNRPEEGSSSQDQPCFRPGEEITREQNGAIAGIVENDGFRTNALLYNAGTAGTLELTLLLENGPTAPITISMAEKEIRQLNSLARVFTEGPVNAATLLLSPSAGMELTVSAARVDNRTNDPAGLPVLLMKTLTP